MAQGHNNTLAAMFHDEASLYTKIVAGYTVPVRAMFKEGDTLTAKQARALSAYFLERGASTANSTLTRGSWKDLSDNDKLAKVTAYLSGNGDGAYNFSDDIGGDVFGNTLLMQATMDVIAAKNVAKLAALDDESRRKSLEAAAVKFIHDPAGVAIADDVRDAIATIKATRHAPKEKGEAKKKETVELTLD